MNTLSVLLFHWDCIVGGTEQSLPRFPVSVFELPITIMIAFRSDPIQQGDISTYHPCLQFLLQCPYLTDLSLQ